MRWRTIAAVALLWCAVARGENAILECTADTWIVAGDGISHGRDTSLELGSGKRMLLQFRIAAIDDWSVQKAVLLLHVSSKLEPGNVRISLIESPWKEYSGAVPRFGREVPAEEQIRPDGWIGLTVATDLVQALVDRKAYGLAIRLVRSAQQHFDSRETIQYSPYLVVQGHR